MIVHNPTDVAVRDYPIQDPKTGEVLLWSIAPGETLDFPEHAGAYLVEIYAFLQRVVTRDQLESERKLEEAKARGKQFSPVKVVDSPGGLTNAIAQQPAPDQSELAPKNPVLTPPDKQMMGAIVGDEADKVPAATSSQIATPPVSKVQKAGASTSGKTICPECKQEFQNKAAAKTHYAHTHLDIPGL